MSCNVHTPLARLSKDGGQNLASPLHIARSPGRQDTGFRTLQSLALQRATVPMTFVMTFRLAGHSQPAETQ